MFVIPIQERKVKSHQITAMHLFALFLLIALSSITIFILKWFGNDAEIRLGSDSLSLGLATLILGSSFILLMVVVYKNKSIVRLSFLNRSIRILELIMLIICLTAAISIQNIILLFLIGLTLFGVFAALILEWSLRKNEQIEIDDKGVKLSGIFFKNHLQWFEIERILLRHGTLTIDTTRKKRYQWLTVNEQNGIALEDFARQQIDLHKEERTNDW